MKLLRNGLTLVSQPALVPEYLKYLSSRRGGQVFRRFHEDDIEIGGISGFSEFHSCASFVSKQERHFVRNHPFGAGALIDVGANLGLFSLVVARLFPTRPVHAFEPNPTTFLALQGNLNRNGCANARAHPVALAEREGEILFEVDAIDRGTTRIIRPTVTTQQQRRTTAIVPCLSLDEFARREGLSEIALLKVDVEGEESAVLEGARELLATQAVEVVYFEVCPELATQAGYSPDTAAKRLEEHGYRLHRLDSNGQLVAAERADIESVRLANWVGLRPT